jgi:hypothetical protein
LCWALLPNALDRTKTNPLLTKVVTGFGSQKMTVGAHLGFALPTTPVAVWLTNHQLNVEEYSVALVHWQHPALRTPQEQLNDNNLS